MENKWSFKKIGNILVFILVFNFFSPLFNVKTYAYESSSQEIEQELKRIVSKYGEENIIFEDGIYAYMGEDINLNNYEEDKDVMWKSEDEDIVKIEDNKIIGVQEGTTFIVGNKGGKYSIREVYVSRESSNVMSANFVESRANSQYIVYIDPGHGGYDPGAQGNGVVEKDIVLNLGLRLKEKLEANGIKVIMSRTSDVYVSLEDRSKGANNANPDAFISIHINSAGATSAKGIETYYYKGIDKPLAESVQNKLISYTGATNRGVKWEEFYVVKNTTMPASLVEIGFLSNVSEANNLKNWSYQEKLVNAMLDGVLNYLYDKNVVTATRIYGSDRYETSYKLFESGWSSSEYVVLASGLDYPDALCATPLASKYNAPILLVRNTSLNNQGSLVKVLKDKGVKNVFIVGGSGVVPASFESELSKMGINSKRLGGSTRYDTSIQIAKEVGNSSQEVAVVTGYDFADGLSIASVAAIRNMPIILTKKDELPTVTANYLKSINISKSYIIGETGVVSNSVANKLSNVTRIGGINRYETNKKVFDTFKSDINVNNIYISSGANFPDALAVSALSAKYSGFVVLSAPNSVDKNVKELITSIRPNINNLYVIGGNTVVSDNVLYQISVNYIK